MRIIQKAHLYKITFARLQGYKTFTMLHSAEHEILPTNKQQITDNFNCFLVQCSRVWNFLCLLIWKCQLKLAFSYLLTEKILCSAALSMKNVNTLGSDYNANVWTFKTALMNKKWYPNECLVGPSNSLVIIRISPLKAVLTIGSPLPFWSSDK